MKHIKAFLAYDARLAGISRLFMLNRMINIIGNRLRIFRPLKCCRATNGFTLLETMFAVSIIAIALVSIYQLHTRTISMNIDTRFYAVAPFLAQEKLSQLELTPLKEIYDDSGDFGEDFPGYTYKIEIGSIETDMLGAVIEDMRRINITIGFNNNEYTYKLNTYRLFRR